MQLTDTLLLLFSSRHQGQRQTASQESASLVIEKDFTHRRYRETWQTVLHKDLSVLNAELQYKMVEYSAD